jgi:hypothetical protein
MGPWSHDWLSKVPIIEGENAFTSTRLNDATCDSYTDKGKVSSIHPKKN